jgi:hypothetical protein
MLKRIFGLMFAVGLASALVAACGSGGSTSGTGGSITVGGTGGALGGTGGMPAAGTGGAGGGSMDFHNMTINAPTTAITQDPFPFPAAGKHFNGGLCQ